MEPEEFAGFRSELLNFLRERKANSDRAWFEKHKPRYEAEVLAVTIARRLRLRRKIEGRAGLVAEHHFDRLLLEMIQGVHRALRIDVAPHPAEVLEQLLPAVEIGAKGPRFSAGRSGFGSHVSIWLGPPAVHSRMTLLRLKGALCSAARARAPSNCGTLSPAIPPSPALRMLRRQGADESSIMAIESIEGARRDGGPMRRWNS